MATLVNAINVIVPILMLIITIIWIIKFVLTDAPQSTGTFLSMKAFMSPDTIKWAGVLQSAAVMCELFIGFDIATTLAGEAKNPTKTVPRAVIIIVVYTLVSFFLTAYLFNCGWVYEDGMLNDPNTAITEYYVYLGLGWMNLVFVPINTIACIGCCIAGNISSSRILYNMARDGFLPKKFFGFIHPKHKTPSFNIALAGVAGLSALLFQGQVMDAANLCSFGGLLGMVLVNVCVIGSYWYKDKRRGTKNFLRYVLMPGAAAACTLFLWCQLSAMAKIVGFSFLALGAIILGMVYNFLPFMVLPIYNALEKIDKNVINAARDLGADGRITFLRVIFPLSLPGVISGVTMVFIPALTTFVVSSLLGGGKILLIGNVIEQEFMVAYDWNLGSGLSLVLLIFIIINVVISAVTEKGEEAKA